MPHEEPGDSAEAGLLDDQQLGRLFEKASSMKYVGIQAVGTAGGDPPVIGCRRGERQPAAVPSIGQWIWALTSAPGRPLRSVMAARGDPWVIGCRRPFQHGRGKTSMLELRRSVQETSQSWDRPRPAETQSPTELVICL